MSERELEQEREQELIEKESVERELSLLLLLHVFFSFLLAALLVYGLLLPGPFTTILEIPFEKDRATATRIGAANSSRISGI